MKIHTPKVSTIIRLSDFKGDQRNQDDTERVQLALMVCPPHGLVVFDEPIYHLTNLYLRSHQTLYIPEGTTVYGNPDEKAYPKMPGQCESAHGEKPFPILSWEGAPFEGMPSLFNAFHETDIAVVGLGKIDMQAQLSHFWDDVKHLKWARPNIFFFNDCQEVTLQGLSIKNSASWTLHPYFSEKLGFYDLYIENPKDSPNTDGIDPECCREVKIIGVRFSVGDDCIALKSGKIYVGRTYKRPCEKVVIRNCYMHEGHGAIVLGSEAGAGIKELTVERCLFEGTDRGLRIKSRRGRGQDCVMDGVKFSHIVMKDVKTPLAASMFYFCDPDGKDDWVQDKKARPVDETTPYLGSFEFDHLVCTGAEVCLGVFYGLPERPIQSITIRDSSFSMKKDAPKGQAAMMCGLEPMHNVGFLFYNVNEVRLLNVTANGFLGEEAVRENVASYINQ
jgi:polygalacturonase